MTKEVLLIMRAAYGHILNISSIGGLRSFPADFARYQHAVDGHLELTSKETTQAIKSVK